MANYNSISENLPEKKTRLCIVPVCAGERFDLVHKFPNDPTRAEMWKEILDVPALKNLTIDTIRKRYFVCSRHFRPSDYKNIVSRGLNKTAFPSINLKALDNLDVIDRNFPDKIVATRAPSNDVQLSHNNVYKQLLVYNEEYLEESLNATNSTLIDHLNNQLNAKRKKSFQSEDRPEKYLHLGDETDEYILSSVHEEYDTVVSVEQNLISNSNEPAEEPEDVVFAFVDVNNDEDKQHKTPTENELKKIELKNNENQLIAIAENNQVEMRETIDEVVEDGWYYLNNEI